MKKAKSKKPKNKPKGQTYGFPYILILKNNSDEIKDAKLFGYWSNEEHQKAVTNEELNALSKEMDEVCKNIDIKSGLPNVTYLEMCMQINSQRIKNGLFEIISDNPLQNHMPIMYKKPTENGGTYTGPLNLKSSKCEIECLGEGNQFQFCVFPKTTVIIKIYPGLKTNSRKTLNPPKISKFVPIEN